MLLPVVLENTFREVGAGTSGQRSGAPARKGRRAIPVAFKGLRCVVLPQDGSKFR